MRITYCYTYVRRSAAGGGFTRRYRGARFHAAAPSMLRISFLLAAPAHFVLYLLESYNAASWRKRTAFHCCGSICFL
jgi:hypothetical protein